MYYVFGTNLVSSYLERRVSNFPRTEKLVSPHLDRRVSNFPRTEITHKNM